MQCPQDYYYNKVDHSQLAPDSNAWVASFGKKQNTYYIGPPYNCKADPYNENVSQDCDIDFWQFCTGGNPGGWSTIKSAEGRDFYDQPSDTTIRYTVHPFAVNCVPNQPSMTDDAIMTCCSQAGPKNPGDCAVGYCAMGPSCVNDMARICKAQILKNGMWDDRCAIYYGGQIGNATEATLSFAQIMESQIKTTSYTPNNPFNDIMTDVCPKLQGACDDSLVQYCAGTQRGEMLMDPKLAAICGCFMPPDNNHYPFFNKQIPVECDPVCNIAKIQQTSQGKPLLCGKTVCIIDDVSFNIINSSGGNITFNQLCGNCSTNQGADSTGCGQCYIDGLSSNEINSVITNGVTIDQMCGQCFAAGTNPEQATTIPCGGTGPNSSVSKKWMIRFLVGIAAMFFLTIIITTFLYFKKIISGKIALIINILAVVLTVTATVVLYFLSKKWSSPTPLPPQSFSDNIAKVAQPSVYLLGGQWVMEWTTPEHSFSQPSPPPIMYSLQIFDSNMQAVDAPYEGVAQNYVTLDNLPPAHYNVEIIAYSGSIISSPSVYPFQNTEAPTLVKFLITSITAKSIHAKITSGTLPGLQSVDSVLKIWIPPNSPSINPLKPSFTFPVDTTLGNNTFSCKFDMIDLKVAQNIFLSGTFTSSTYNWFPTPYRLGTKDLDVGVTAVLPNALDNTSWIYDPVTQILSAAENQPLKWSLLTDKYGVNKFVGVSTTPAEYFPLTLKPTTKANNYYAYPLQSLIGPSPTMEFGAIYLSKPPNGPITSQENIYMLGPYTYNPNIDLSDWSFSVEATIISNNTKTTIRTPIKIF